MYSTYLHVVLLSRIKNFIGGPSALSSRVSELRELNSRLERDCVVRKGDNRVLRGDFRMALNSVTGYVVDESRPWCGPYARSEPSFYKRLRQHQTLRINELSLRGIVL